MKDTNLASILTVFAGVTGMKFPEAQSFISAACNSSIDDYALEKINENLDFLFKNFSNDAITLGELKEGIRDIAYSSYDNSELFLQG
tara:strand:+ start:8523 stop:8783 length:261 start_codon:yes stop_codon:yes gene_type:complete